MFLNFLLCQHPDLEGHPLPLPRKWNVSGTHSPFPNPFLPRGLSVRGCSSDSCVLWPHFVSTFSTKERQRVQREGHKSSKTKFTHPECSPWNEARPNYYRDLAGIREKNILLQRWKMRGQGAGGRLLSHGGEAGRGEQTWPSGSGGRAEPAGRGRAGKKETLDQTLPPRDKGSMWQGDSS